MFHLEMMAHKVKVSQHWREQPRWKDQVCPLLGCLAILQDSPAPGMYFVDANSENYAQLYGSEAASEAVSRVGTPTVPPPGSVIIERFKDYGYPKPRASQSQGSHSVHVLEDCHPSVRRSIHVLLLVQVWQVKWRFTLSLLILPQLCSTGH
jgi:hypothetical protein